MTAMIRRAAVIGALFATGLASTALAATNSIHVKAPAGAKVGQPYSVTLSGHAAKAEKLYMFVDYYRCGSTPAVEYNNHHANGDFWNVKGRFKETSSGWRSPDRAPYHVCAYLFKRSSPRIPANGLIAHKFVTFQVH